MNEFATISTVLPSGTARDHRFGADHRRGTQTVSTTPVVTLCVWPICSASTRYQQVGATARRETETTNFEQFATSATTRCRLTAPQQALRRRSSP